MLYDFLNHVITVFAGSAIGTVGEYGSGERKSRALQELDCAARTMNQCAAFWVFYFAR